MRFHSLRLHGAIPALVTPFRAGDGEVDGDALARLALRAVSRGCTGVLVCGSTGEAAAMTLAEQARAIRTVADAVGAQVPVLAGIGASCTQAAIAMAASAEQCGAAALLCSAPPYVKPSQQGMAAHVRAVGAACGLPVVLYDVPARAGVRFDDATIATLYGAGDIVALKDATGELARPAALRRLCGADFTQLAGDDATALAHLAMGGVGCVSVTANIAPALCAALQQAWHERDIERAAQLRDALAPLHQLLFAETNPVPVKGALGLLGLCDATPRLPLLRAGDALLAGLGRCLDGLMPLEDSRARSRQREQGHAAPGPRLPRAAAALPWGPGGTDGGDLANR